MKLRSKSLKILLERSGFYLRELREELGYGTINEFTNRFHLPLIQYWRIENGKANFTLKSLSKLLAIHGLSVEEFFCALGKY